jgi:type IV pilus assembly protein PilA
MTRSHHLKSYSGFTLVELMIVVAIIGILASFAIPAYQDYTKRSHVTEGLALAAAAKSSVTEFYSSKGYFPSSNSSAGLAQATSIAGNAVSQIEVLANGVVEVTYNAKVASSATLRLTPSFQSGWMRWDCATGGTVPARLRPTSCR